MKQTIVAMFGAATLVVLAFPQAAASQAAAPAAAASPAAAPKPLRHLSYAVAVGVETRQDLNNFNGHMTSGKGDAQGRGSITADVTGLGADKALFITIAEQSDTRKAPPVNVQVLADGRIAFNPSDAGNLNPEEQALLSLLGRAVVADHDLAEGKEWKVSIGSVGSTDVTTYKVLSLTDDDKVNLAVERAANIGGAQPMEFAVTGKVLYDFKYSAPITATLNEHMVTSSEGVQNTSDLSFEYRLTQDSLAGVAVP
jgi:hypothetical protein